MEVVAERKDDIDENVQEREQNNDPPQMVLSSLTPSSHDDRVLTPHVPIANALFALNFTPPPRDVTTPPRDVTPPPRDVTPPPAPRDVTPPPRDVTLSSPPTSPKEFQCGQCDKTYGSWKARRRHVRATHEGRPRPQCPKCKKTFARNDNLRKHLRNCKDVGDNFPSTQTGGNGRNNADDGEVQAGRTDCVDDVDENDRGTDTVPDDVESVIHANKQSIQSSTTIGRVQDRYNFEIDDTHPLEPRIRGIFESLTTAARMNASYGFILRHMETGELRYYHASANNARLLEVPHSVQNADDFDNFVKAIIHEDREEWARLHRENTKWVVVRVTNVTVYVNKLRKHPIGTNVILPAFIRNNRGVFGLTSTHKGRPYTDNLCLFRCLALHRGKTTNNLERTAQKLYRTYSDTPVEDFDGVTLEELHGVEKMFQLNIDVFVLEEDEDEQGAGVARFVRRSPCTYSETMSVNLFERHFSYINNLRFYTRSFACSHCGKLWTILHRMRRHEKTCTEHVRHIFPSGTYQPHPTIFEQLEDELINVPEELRYFNYRATFDFESYFKPDISEPTDRLKWIAEHVPMSVSVASNVPGFEQPVCFVSEGCSFRLVDEMVSYLHEISNEAERLVAARLKPYREQLQTKLRELMENNNDPTLADENAVEKQPLMQLTRMLDSYAAQLPVIGFNSGKYDVNLIKAALMRNLSQHDCRVIKRCNNFMSISTPNLRFLDMVNYLAPGYSYDSYLKAYGCAQEKGHFPYEYITNLDQLNERALPPHHAFYSELKKSNISAEEYARCLSVWEDENMTCMRDFLRWYNNLDVSPFLEAIEKQFDFYRQLGIDMFKGAVSAPGLTLNYLFKTLEEDQTFALFGTMNQDLYYTLKQNIVGGPSIIFHRYHETDKTWIRHMEYGADARKCETIEGFDANALYLWALSQPMPTGYFIRRRAEDNFRPRKSQGYGFKAASWLSWVREQNGQHIRHMFNNSEKRIGPRKLPVDGFCRDSHTVYQFLGCYFHRHNPDECANYHSRNEDGTWGLDDEEVREQTDANLQYVKNCGYTLVSIRECEWDREVKQNPQIKKFLKERARPSVVLNSDEEILHGIVDETWFGLIECDVEVPDDLKEYFQELPPIFKNAEVSREDIGANMRSYAEENHILTKARRMLISSYTGEKVMLTTPLAKWYLQHGVKITKIYQIVEYEKKDTCFGTFEKTVTTARREGDKDKDKEIIANTMKLFGNSGYSKTITSKERHRAVYYCNDDNVDEFINNKYFRQLNELCEGYYEVEMSKHTIKFDLPFQIGYFVYQYAKLRILQFLYDFIDRFISRRDYQLCEMDTDSLYIALSSNTLETIVIPEKLEEFKAQRGEFLMSESCELHQPDFIASKLNGHEWDANANACCKTKQMHEMRTPGLFKTEWKGDAMVCLNSKTYYCLGPKIKYSTKGLNKRQNEMTKDMFLNVIESKQSGSGVNRGFRVRSNKIYTYSQSKNALTYFYPKRIVLNDGVTTIPLNI